ncbi:MAG: archaeosortase/exosortase family protein, partial [Gammaproteobacteria bacterium]
MPIRDTIAKPQNTVFILLVAVGVLYSDTIFSYYQLWMESGNPAYSHGSLAFVIALYIFLRYWLRTETLPPLKIHFAGFVLLLLSSLAWFVA